MKQLEIICLLVGLTFSSWIEAAKTNQSAPRLTAQERYEQRLREVQEYNAYVERYMARDISHRLGGWGQLGYSSILGKDFSSFQVNSTGNIGGGLGLGYQLRYKRLLVQTGAEFQVYQSKWSLYSDDKQHPQLLQSYPIQISSPYGDVDAQAVYKYANTNDKLLAGYLQIPILVGMELLDHQMYFLVGPKLGWSVLHQSLLTTNASLTINDQELISPLENLPSHNLAAQDMSAKQSPKFGMNVALSAEIGMSLDKYYQPDPEIKKSRLTDAQKRLQNLHTRIAVFGEYGVANINTSQPRQWQLPFSEPSVGDPIDLSQVQICSSIQTISANSAHINPWMVGVKVSVMYDLPRKQLRTKALPKAPQTPTVVKTDTLPPPADEPAPLSEVFTYEEQQISVGEKIKLDNLFFATNKTEVLPESEPSLEQLYNFLKDNPKVSIMLVGHTDSIGSERDNQILSEGRVNSVRQEMIKRGIESSRIQVEGRGESQPVDTNSTEQGRQNNRRVEMIIIKVDGE